MVKQTPRIMMPKHGLPLLTAALLVVGRAFAHYAAANSSNVVTPIVATYDDEAATYAFNAGIPYGALAYNGLALRESQPGDLLVVSSPPRSVSSLFGWRGSGGGSGGGNGDGTSRYPNITTRYGGSGILSFRPKRFFLGCTYAAPKARTVAVACVVRATGQTAAGAVAGPFYFTFTPVRQPTTTPPAPGGGVQLVPSPMQLANFPPGVDVTTLVFAVIAAPTASVREWVKFHMDDFSYDVVTEF